MDKIMEVKKRLMGLAGKQNLLITKSCDEAIRIVLQHLMDSGRHMLLCQDQGGWLSYKIIGDKLGYKQNLISTLSGRLNAEELKRYAGKGAVLIMHSMPGYCFEEDMIHIHDVCRELGIVLVNDCCGSVGTGNAKIGDYVVCSFGRWKPLCLGEGGFLASDDKFWLTKDYPINSSKLAMEIDSLSAKLGFWRHTANRIKSDFSDRAINAGEQGINVLLSYQDEADKEKLIKYCESNNFEYTICPRYIRSNEHAVCVEIKRLAFKED